MTVADLAPGVPHHGDAVRQVLGLSRLIQLEGDLRQAETVRAIDFIAVNDTNRVVAYDHALIWRTRPMVVTAISGGLIVEPNAPQIQFFGRLARHLHARAGETVVEATAEQLPAKLCDGHRRWVPGTAAWVPLLGPRGGKEGGLIVLRAQALSDSERRILARVGSAIGQAIVALEGKPRRWRLGFKPLTVGAVAAACITGAVPVPVTILAEAKVAPVDPTIVAAPLDGVIKNIPVQPNDEVLAGRTLVTFDDTELKSQRDLAAKHVAVLTADWQRLEEKAFTDDKARADIAAARSRLSEGEQDLALAVDRLRRAEIKAAANGVVLLEDREQWLGRPVKVGERILSLADPKAVHLEIQVPVEDALVVTPGAQVEFFLAIAPASPVPARLTRMSYEARLRPGQTAVFVAEAALLDAASLPRLGLTGTVKIYGDKAVLAYVLLRKPLSHLRRVMGF